MRRYLETLFRRKGIFLTPLIVTPLLAMTFLALLGPQHEVGATLWVDRSPLIGAETQGRGDRNPNAIESQALNEWLRTSSFREQVLQESGLGQRVQNGTWPRLNGVQEFSRSVGLDSIPGLSGVLRSLGIAGPATRDEAMGMAMQTIRQSIRASSEGDNLLLIEYSGSDPVVGSELVEAVIGVYREWTLERGSEALNQALEFQAQQVEIQEERMGAASERLSSFLAENPAPRSQNVEAQLQRLNRNYELEQEVYEDAVRQLNAMRLEGEAAVSGRGQGFQVIDPPQTPEGGGTEWRLVIMTLFLGLVIGSALGVAGIAMITWADGTVRDQSDLDGLIDAPVRGEIPLSSGNRKGGPHMGWLLARGYSR